MTAAPYLTPQQVTQLLHAIKPSRVSHRDGQSHLEAYDVRAHLNRVFGFARWSSEVLDSSLLFEDVHEVPGKGMRVWVGYRVRLQLTICSPDGAVLARYTEEATGDGSNFPISKRADCHDFGLKTAESQALKRCAINLGDQFGLSLYAKGSTAAVVTGTLVGLPPPEEKTGDGEKSASVDEAAPDVVPEQPQEQEPGPPSSGEDAPAPDGAPPVNAEAQALADLAPRMKTVDDLASGVYEQAKARHLLRHPVADPVTGEVRQLTQVIQDAKARLTQKQKENDAA